jgi:succinate dehydrogenase / fumarate reductase, cytochrome b subunit
MSTASKTLFDSSIGRKIIMALTGLFLCTFLVVHLAGNLQLLKNDGGQAFNVYSKFMAGNVLIKIVAYVNYIAILGHVIYSLILTLGNRRARPKSYAKVDAGKNSFWTSRNMGILGTIILVFIIVHMADFWYEFKFGHVPQTTITTEEGLSYMIKNYYAEVAEAFQQGWYVALYTVSMAAIAFHLSHGFQSAFQSLGLRHSKYTPFIKMLGYGFSIVIPTLFAIIPLYFYFFK